jgi:hypothetical protein
MKGMIFFMKNKVLILLSISVLLSSIIISFSIVYSMDKVLSNDKILFQTYTSKIPKPQFKFIMEGNKAIIFNENTGEYWEKFIPTREGPTEWEKGDGPIKTNK